MITTALLMMLVAVASTDGCVKTVNGTSNGKCCVFPFRANGKEYNNCTDINNNYRLWCGTTADVDTDKEWGNCVTGRRVQTVGGNGNGKSCVFPFRAYSKEYNSCTDISNSYRLWCATTSDFDTDKEWGNCVAERHVRTVEGNANGKPCVFPFRAYGTEYQSCTDTDNKYRLWCATTPDFDADHEYGNCVTERRVQTVGGNGNGKPCVLPFRALGKEYWNCTNIDNRNRLWCATTPDYDADHEWGNCVTDVRCLKTVDGTSNGKCCVFPFRAYGKEYNNCTDVGNNNKLWCGTTPDYDADNEWGNCVTALPSTTAATAPTDQCSYEGKVYTNGQRFVSKCSSCTCLESNRVSCVPLCAPVQVQCMPGHVMSYTRKLVAPGCYCKEPICIAALPSTTAATTPTDQCFYEGKVYTNGQRFVSKCSSCTCESNRVSQSVICVPLCAPVQVQCMPGHVMSETRKLVAPGCYCKEPICIAGQCPGTGWCLTPDGRDQNDGTKRLEASSKDTCLAACRRDANAKGCEWSGQTCVRHTHDVGKGSDKAGYSCWVFSKCQEH